MNSSTKSKIAKFLFEQEFDTHLLVPNNNKAEAEAAKLAKVREEGFTEGEAAGYSRGRDEKTRELEGQIAALLGKIQKDIQRMLGEVADYRGQLVEQAHGLALAAFRKLHPEMTRRGQADEIGALLSMVMNEQAEEPRLSLHLAKENLEAMEGTLNTIVEKEGYQGRVSLIPDPQMQPGDCRIEWRHGGIERDLTALTQAVENILAAMTRSEG